MRQTKPISVGPELELNPLRKKIYAVCAPLTGSAKQSQFSLQCRSGDRRSRAAKRATTPRCPVSFRQQSQLPEAGHRGGVRRTKKKGKCLAGKELWLIEHSIGLGKTKPIRRGWDAPAELPGELSPGHDAPNKPNLRQKGRQGVVQTNPIPPAGKEEASALRERIYGESYSL